MTFISRNMNGYWTSVRTPSLLVKQRDCMVCGTQSAFVNCLTASGCVYSSTGMTSISSGAPETLVTRMSRISTWASCGMKIVHSVLTP